MIHSLSAPTQFRWGLLEKHGPPRCHLSVPGRDSAKRGTARKCFQICACYKTPRAHEIERMLEAVVCFSLLAFGNPGFASDEHRSSTQPGFSGVAMSPLNKSDVKNHLSMRDRNGKRLHAVPSVADATGFSGAESGSAEAEQVPQESLGQQSASPDRPTGLKPVLVAAAR